MRFIPALTALIIAGLLGWFAFSTNAPDSRYAVKLGLDLAGGTELIYRADTSEVGSDRQGALNSLREVIERRVNLFGVAEPLVYLERSSGLAGEVEDRLVVELPGVTDVAAAVDALGQTPLLEFKLVSTTAAPTTVDGTTTVAVREDYESIGLTGRYLERAELQFGSTVGQGLANEPVVVLTWNDEGARLFEEVTRENVGRQLAIFLDGDVISSPVIREAIPGGTATISGGFSPTEARDLVRNLNFGALPVPIELASSNAVGATLGTGAYEAGLAAGAIGFLLVALFMVLWYRLPGIVATVALVAYVIATIAIIKFIPVTLTASGIAALIISVGMAVDANILIFERMKEELRAGKGAREAALEGFKRAWPAIRDGHLTSLIAAIILFWLGTSIVQGFALVFGLGIIVSLITAVSMSRALLLAVLPEEAKGAWRFFLSSGLHTK